MTVYLTKRLLLMGEVVTEGQAGWKVNGTREEVVGYYIDSASKSKRAPRSAIRMI